RRCSGLGWWCSLAVYSDGGMRGVRTPVAHVAAAWARTLAAVPGRGSAAASLARVAVPLGAEDELHHLLLDRRGQVHEAAAGAPPGDVAANLVAGGVGDLDRHRQRLRVVQ